MNKRESMVIYRSFYEAIKDLTPNDQAKVWGAVFDYGLNEHEQELEGLPNTIFKLIKPQLDANLRKYENGQKGGRPKNLTETKAKPNHNLSETKLEPKHNLTESKPKPNENVNDNVNVNENENVNAVGFSPPSVSLVLDEFPDFRDAKRFVDFYTSKGWKVGAVPMADWRAAVRSWIEREKEKAAQLPPAQRQRVYKKAVKD